MQDQNTSTSGAKGCLTRALWTMGIPVLAIFNLILFIEKRPVFPSIYDLLYLILLLALIAVRYIDIAFLNGTSDDGSMATKKDWRSFASAASVIFIVAWAIVRLLLLLNAK